MPTVMLGTTNDALNLNFFRAAAAADAKAASGSPVTHPPAPGYTATLGLVYGTDTTMNRNWDTLDLVISSGAVPAGRVLRYTPNATVNLNFGRLLVTLAGAGLVIPTA